MSTISDAAYVGQVADWLRLFIRPGQVTELRALDVVTNSFRRPHVMFGFFDYDHVGEMAQAAFQLTQYAKGVYFTLNPLNRALLARCCNRVDVARNSLACDADVSGRSWLLVDVDPKRPSGVSASDSEKLKAREKTGQVWTYLRSLGWPEPIGADSGNGYHLLYSVDLPADDGGLLQRILIALAAKFDDEWVTVDRTVYNASRIVKLYGTIARKGDQTTERPHRWTAAYPRTTPIEIVPREKLEVVAAQARCSNDPTGQIQSDDKTVAARARRYLQLLPPAVSGDHGHDRAFRAACVLVRGFGLSPEQALPLFQEYNERCAPPWKNDELSHKLAGAEKQIGARGYLLGASAQAESASSGFQSRFVNSEDLEKSTEQSTWLVKKIMVADQPVVVGGPKKALKTSIIVDLAISLATGRPFLGRFEVPRPVKVLVLSGESGQAAILNTAKRICLAKRLEFKRCSVLWGFQLPWLSSATDRSTLSAGLVANGIEVVMIDPLYLCLLAGNGQGRQAGNVFDMGPVLLNIAQTCLDVGTTPILIHHTRKISQQQKNQRWEPIDLEDLAFSGTAEFARQWLLVSPREKFDPEKGEHRLWLSVGGSAGHAGLYGLDVCEGVMDDNFGGRQWSVIVQSATAVVEQKQDRKKQEKAAANRENKQKVLDALEHSTTGMTAPDIAKHARLSKDRTRKVLSELRRDDKIEEAGVTKNFGTGTMKYDGWRLRRDDTAPSPGQVVTS